MFALTTTLSMAEADPSESRNTDIEMTAAHFAAAHWVAEFLARRTIDTSTPPSAAGETCELSDSIPDAEMAPA
jgi:hypothetical protein